MEYSKKHVIETVKGFSDFKVNQDKDDSESSFFVEFAGVSFLLTFASSDGNEKNRHKLNASFGVNMAFPLSNKWGQDIELIDKYRIVNKVNENSPAQARVFYDEKMDAFFITALYYPFLEQLPELRHTTPLFENKALKFIIISLSTMCLEIIETIKQSIKESHIIKNSYSEFKKRISDEK